MRKLILALASLPIVYAHEGTVGADELIWGAFGALIVFGIIVYLLQKRRK